MSSHIFNILALIFVSIFGHSLLSQSIENNRFEGYRPIWFELNQKYEYGDKYSGALGTYTAKHRPLAIYSSETNKTFFVYGGTKDYDQKHLLCMIGVYDHSTGEVSRPFVVSDKMGIDDPHDNPSLLIDDGVGTVSIISRADSYGRGLAEATAAAFEAAGGTVKTIVYHATDATEFSSEVTAVGKGGAEAIVGILFPETGCGVLQPAFEQGLLDTPWYMTDGVKDAGLASLCGLGTALDGFKGTAPGSAAGEAKDAFEAAYAGVSADGSPTFIFAPQAYDAVMLMAISAAANGVTGPEIASGLIAASSGGEKCIGVACIALAADGVDVDYVGASGEVELDQAGDPTAATYDIWTTEGDTNPVLKSVDFGS